MKEAILKKARDFIKKPEYVLDLEDLSVLWVSEKMASLIGYTSEEMMKQSAVDFLDDSYTVAEKRKATLVTMDRERGIESYNFKTKSGETKKVTFHYGLVEYEGGFYEVGEFAEEE
ncbi:PAS domain-containing protein [Candidatus Woesearchaeota archaeon]|nr:PAS domain-containing protein [Candidatus Woesearchaeota archaeon]